VVAQRQIILKTFTDEKKSKRLPDFESTTYKTYDGYFRSSCLASVQFKFIEFGLLKDRVIEYEMQVDEMQQQKDTNYDMIIGSDLMYDLGISLDYYDKVIRIKNSKYEDSIPMRKLGMLQCNKISQMIYDMHTESPVLQQEEERQSKILDCNYSKVDIQKLVSDLGLSRDSKRKLTKSLAKFQKLFSGGLGKVELKKPIDIELEKGATPYYGGYYSVPHMLQKPLKKEVNRMVEADILKRLPFDKDTPWGAPSFCQPKKDQGIRFLTDFRQINKRIKRKPFPLPKIV